MARTDTNGTAYYHSDGNGNVTSLIDTNQYIVARYLYDPFGRTIGKWGVLADINLLRFSSKEWDEVSGLYYYLYRFYDPKIQRWINQDPLENLDGGNLYVFSQNNPVGLFDSEGLLSQGLSLDQLIKFIAEAILGAAPTITPSFSYLATDEPCCCRGQKNMKEKVNFAIKIKLGDMGEGSFGGQGVRCGACTEDVCATGSFSLSVTKLATTLIANRIVPGTGKVVAKYLDYVLNVKVAVGGTYCLSGKNKIAVGAEIRVGSAYTRRYNQKDFD